MATFYETISSEEFAEVYEAELPTPNIHCFDFMCFWPIGHEYRQLLHKDCAKEKESLDERRRREKDIAVPESVTRARWKSVVHEISRQSNNTGIARRRRPSFSYDSRSYALNFDEGDDVGARFKVIGADATRRI